MANDQTHNGSLVAFEGPSDVVSTQLRLLPTSPQILILPSIHNYLRSEDVLEEPLDVPGFVRKVHQAHQTRNDTAQEFLRESTAENKRLVFANGGTPSAQLLCINAICKFETDGDRERAELIYNDVVKNGLAGLDDWRREAPVPDPEPEPMEEYNEHEDDPITRAMRAADELYRQTAELQPCQDLELPISTRPRSMSLPIYGFADHFGDAAPFYVFGARAGAQAGYDEQEHETYEDLQNRVPPTTPRLAISHFDDPDAYEEELVCSDDEEMRFFPPKSPSCVGEAYRPISLLSHLAPDLVTPRSATFSIRSVENVSFGEATLVDLKSSSFARSSPNGRRLRRTRSLDRLMADRPSPRDLLAADPWSGPLSARPHLGEEGQPFKSRPFSTLYFEGARTVLVRQQSPSISTVTLSPVPVGKKKKRSRARASYVDRGTDCDDLPQPPAPFQAVLPFCEDLVIYFKDGSPEENLYSVVQAYKTGKYPILEPSPPASIASEPIDAPGTPVSVNVPQVIQELVDGDSVGPLDPQQPAPGPESDDYDPFAYNPKTWAGGKQPNQQQTLHIVSQMRAPAPPTPAQTPPPPVPSETEEKFHDFSIVNCDSAVAMQNSLRSILNIYFPHDGQGYRQFNFPLLPELDDLWRPIFREAEPDSPRSDSRRIDQILAIGAQRGVKRDYVSAITGQLEKLGAKPSGVSRSGRLDFRYLIANAMQAFTAQRLTHQSTENPFTNSYLLATLIIPHLETYLAAHSEVRFLLLEYPPDHLPTILALQKLVGVDLMKVAQIVDSNAKELPFTHIRGASISGAAHPHAAGMRPTSPGTAAAASASGAKALPPTPTASPDSLSISRANYLLTSSASDAEIGTFISTIWNILMEVSPFYVPEEPPKTPKVKKVPAPLAGPFSPFPKVTPGPQSPPLSPPPLSPRFAPRRPPSPTPSVGAPSITSTVKTSKSGKSRGGDRSRRGAKSVRLNDVDSSLTVDLDPADDSDYDAEVRRLMPMFMRRPAPRKPNSHKALKFLGLA